MYIELLNGEIKNKNTQEMFPKDKKNRHYKRFLKWVKEGNTPEYESEKEPTLEQLKQDIISAGVEPDVSELTMIPSSTVKLEGDAAKKALRLLEILEDHDDVQQTYANFDIPDDLMD